jgi:hypothetical protein
LKESINPGDFAVDIRREGRGDFFELCDPTSNFEQFGPDQQPSCITRLVLRIGWFIAAENRTSTANRLWNENGFESHKTVRGSEAGAAMRSLNAALRECASILPLRTSGLLPRAFHFYGQQPR